MDPARALAKFRHVHAAHWIADNARKMDTTLTLGSLTLTQPFLHGMETGKCTFGGGAIR